MFEIAKRINAESVDIEACDHILIRANQKLLEISEISAELFE